MAERKAKFAILSYFQKKYSAFTGGETLVINKYSAQWDADALLESYGSDLNHLIDRYFTVSDHPSWKGFCRDAQKIYDSLAAEESDKVERQNMKKRFKEWISD